MIYKIKVTGYIIVEADDPEEAREMAEDEDYIEKCERLGRPVPVGYDEDSGQYVEAKRERGAEMTDKSIPLPKTKTARCFICREPIHDGQAYHAGRVKGEGIAYCHADCFAKEGEA